MSLHARLAVLLLLTGTAALALGTARAASQRAVPLDLSAYRMIDLTHAYNARTVSWPTSPTRFTLERLAYGHTEGGYFYAAYTLCTPEHGGTHLDAPIHFAE